MRSINDAINIANTLAEAIDGGTNSRATHRRASTAKSVFTYGGHRSRANSDTLIYIVNYDNNNGYAIIAAPDSVNPILGFVEDGTFGDFESANNDGLQMFLSSAENYVSTKSSEPTDSGKITITPFYTEWITLVNDTITPRVSVQWGQSLPEGYYFANKTAGSSQVALAQIMSAFELPKRIDLTYEGADAPAMSLDWPEITKHIRSIAPGEDNYNTAIQSHLSSCPATLSNHLVLAKLCRQLDQLNTNASSSETSSDTTIDNARAIAMALLGDKLAVGSVTEMSATTVTSIFESMKNRQEVLYIRGIYSSRNLRYGHDWIIDGGMQTGTITTRKYTVSTEIGNPTPETEVFYDLTTLLHFNWGYNGAGNGYFLPDVYCPSNAYLLDDEPKFMLENFSTDVKFFPISKY